MHLKEKARTFAESYGDVPYQYEHGPLAVTHEDWFLLGLNCQMLIHVAVSEFLGIHFPSDLRSSELFADTQWTYEKKFFGEGDIIFMGERSLQPRRDPKDEDAKKLHVALVTDVANGEVELLHSRYGAGVVVEPLETVQALRRGGKKAYEKIFAIKGLQI